METTDESVTNGESGAIAVSSDDLEVTTVDLQDDTGVANSTTVEIVAEAGMEVELAGGESKEAGQHPDAIDSLTDSFTELCI